MSDEISVYELNELNYNNFLYTIPSKIKGSGFKTLLTNNNQPICFSLVLNKQSNIENNTLKLELDDTNIALLKVIENSFITQAYENRESWFSMDFPLGILEGFYKSFISGNSIIASISDDDINSVYNTDNNSINYDNLTDNSRVEVVFLMESLTFLKTEFFCNIQITIVIYSNFCD